MLKRTHTCGELRQEQVGETVNLAGWVTSYRDHGGILFIDVRDFSGRTQVVFDPDQGASMYELASRLRHEDVIEVRGIVAVREKSNPKLPTGAIEVQANHLELLNKAEKPPILPEDQEGEASEEVRLRYRYIDLRRPRMQEILRTRHRVTQVMRNYLSDRGFIEIETPFLCRSTPEGARDFLVPSRLHRGSFYALPQSPQLFKQILMAAGCDRYMQIVRCFRDEDPRADRQAEFTQLDLEMSFISPEEVIDLLSGLYREIWRDVLGAEIGEIPQMTYTEAMERFGIDRPDLRFGLELKNVSDIAGKTDFRVFTSALEQSDGVVKAICVPGGASALSRKQTDALGEWVKQFGAGGLPLVKVGSDGTSFEAGISKFLSGVEQDLIDRVGANAGDLIFFAADRSKIATRVLGELRIRVARDLDLIDRSQWKFLWVVDFPLLEWNEDEKRWDSPHHPFTAPHPDDLDKLERDPGSVRSLAYDFIVNGSEIAGGSIRIHRAEVQQRVFRHLNISEEEAKAKFSFLLDALRFGCPPHGGVAAGLDRAIMHLAGTENIRDVIAFPKTLNGFDLMTQAPSEVDEGQLDELHIRLSEEAPSAEGSD
ncbi:MAG: aspartate--tRNA ligase [Planctomycetota bacterium]